MSDHAREDQIAMGLFVEGLRKACGRTTGHGEACVTGYECASCSDKRRAADIIERLEYALRYIHEQDEGWRPLIDSALNPLPR